MRFAESELRVNLLERDGAARKPLPAPQTPGAARRHRETLAGPPSGSPPGSIARFKLVRSGARTPGFITASVLTTEVAAARFDGEPRSVGGPRSTSKPPRAARPSRRGRALSRRRSTPDVTRLGEDSLEAPALRDEPPRVRRRRTDRASPSSTTLPCLRRSRSEKMVLSFPERVRRQRRLDQERLFSFEPLLGDD